jgi:iron complex outermembrane recepter protein
MAITERTTANVGYTQGLEDSGVASTSAENRGAILPDARTWQADAGVRYLLTPQVKLIAGVFEIDKPYFNLDTSNVDRALGRQRASGLELSASGEVSKNLSVTAAMLLGDAITHFGSYPASLDDVAQGPAATLIALGGRYRFKILGAPATLRIQVWHLTPPYSANISLAPFSAI